MNNLKYLRNISDRSSILRATVMKWCNENEIDVNDIFLIDQMAAMQQHHSNESYVAICKQDSVIKTKLNHVSTNKTVNIKKQFTLAENILSTVSNQLPQRNKNLHQRRHQALDHQIYLKNKKNVLGSKRKNRKSHLYPLI